MSRTDVVSLFFCGSGQNRDKGDKQLVSHLYNNVIGERKIIFDGPGGAPIRDAESMLTSVQSKGVKDSWWVRWKNFWTLKETKFGRGVTGAGTASNIVMALQWLWDQYHSLKFVDVNVVGFSRGGVSGIMLAHAMHEAGFTRFGNINVNLFTFDPVPGGLNDFKSKGHSFAQIGRVGNPKTLSPIVANYRSVLQQNIKGWAKDLTFKCVVPEYEGSHPRRTPRELFPMPGRHGSAARYDTTTGEGDIGGYLCQQFMERHGTQFRTAFSELTPLSLIEKYASVALTWPQNNASKYRKRLVTNEYLQDNVYVNWHHRELMLHNGLSDVTLYLDRKQAIPPSTLERVKKMGLQWTQDLLVRYLEKKK